MAEQIIDIRERIEKMRIKFDDDNQSNNIYEKKVANDEQKEITNWLSKTIGNNSFNIEELRQEASDRK